MEIAPMISIGERVRFGRPVITGTRVPVDLILGTRAGGMSYEEVMAEYGIPRAAILAVLDHASKVLSKEEIRAVGSTTVYALKLPAARCRESSKCKE